MKRIAVASVDNIHNYGDDILGTTTAWLIREYANANVVRMQFSPGKESELKTMPITFLSSALILHLTGKAPLSKATYTIRNLGIKARVNKYYQRIIHQCDGVVTAVGMFKYASQDHSYLFNALCATTSRLRKPLHISAASISVKDENNILSNQLSNCFSYSSLKMITTRDGADGLNILNTYMPEKGIIRDYVGDPALWIPNVYSIYREKESEVIGIGLVRKNIFLSYRGKDSISEERLIEIYCELLDRLDYKGLKWQLFCNGMDDDYRVGKEILTCRNLPDSFLAKQPESAEELIKTIAKYKAVIGGRFHSVLISYALDIPVIGMDWDDKLRFFFKSIDRSKYLIDCDSLEKLGGGGLLAEKIVEASEDPYDPQIREELKHRTRKYLVDFVNGIGKDSAPISSAE